MREEDLSGNRFGRSITRRGALKKGLLGAAGLLLADGLLPRALAGAPAGAISRSVAAKATSVIQIWLWGGPPHLDTFDPKPEAGDAYAESWALTYYLIKQRPKEYVKYLHLLPPKKVQVWNDPEKRRADLKSVFGDDLAALNRAMLTYLSRLR